MHRLILDVADPGKVVDHINHNKLDNRKENLRICTQTDNTRNKTPKGECPGIRVTESGRYNVRITLNRKEIHVGNYKTLEEAVAARKEAERRYHGEFGYQSHEQEHKEGNVN